ncbi:MAG: SDR family NAD(P)-dependent oxidoreductase, partial [Flavobacteriales bacterium]|nr:SDR family NAD(P)-dependent oxidoreductase [Flavobacteriales bacterium]
MTTSTHLRPDLTDKVVVVTGSSRGIGKAIAIACAQRGAAVVLNGRNQERLASAKAAVEEHTSSVHVVCGDVSDPKEGRRLIEEAVATFGRLDLLVN